MTIKVKVWRDEDTQDPTTWGCWKLVSFMRKHIGCVCPDVAKEECGEQFRAGTAWLLDYYEHGDAIWSFDGEGPLCHWDTSRRAGMLVYVDSYEYASKEEMQEVARNFLKEYNMWMAGECYGYTIVDEHGDEGDSLGGIIGMDVLVDAICDACGKEPFEIMTEYMVLHHDELGEEVARQVKKQEAA